MYSRRTLNNGAVKTVEYVHEGSAIKNCTFTPGNVGNPLKRSCALFTLAPKKSPASLENNGASTVSESIWARFITENGQSKCRLVDCCFSSWRTDGP